MTDLLQTLLKSEDYAPVYCLVAVLLAFQVILLLRGAFDLAFLVGRYTVFSRFNKLSFWLWLVAFTLILYPFRINLSDMIQGLEDYYADPVYYAGYNSIPGSIEIYENQIRKNVTPAKFEILKRRTAEMAAKINSTPLAIYESALLECGLKPFRVRDDKIAAGWIQHTRNGCNGLGITLEQVIAACNRQDINFIMDATEKYLVRRWQQAGMPDMRNTIDLYLAIFAPAHIGEDAEKTVYAGFNNPAYYKNSGLDGWYQKDGIIMHKEGAKDGRITVWEIYLCLEYKKSKLLKE